MIVGLVLLTGAAVVVLNLLADLVLALIDPRVRDRGVDRSALGGLLRVGA
jgi:ABC-type dipeptide/oligopeptide/nickel transport system permease component